MDEATGLLEITVETLKTKIRSDHLGDLLEEVPRLLFSVSANKQFQSDGSTKYLCQIGMLIVTKFAGVVPHDKIEILSSTLLSLFCEWIPNEFKNHDAHTGANCETILTWLITLLTDVEDYDSEVFRAAKPSLVQKVYRCCLKHGIAGSVGSTRVVQAKCLKLVRLLIGRLADPQSTLGKIQALVPTYSPFEVFTMLTSHSKFDVALSRTEEDGKVLIDDCDQLEMVRLMICCVTLSPGSINIEPAVWAAVFSVFNAGLGSIDTAIRRLLYTYCNSSSKVSFYSESCYGSK